MVEGAPLLREYTGNGIEGSNPFLSAMPIDNLYNNLAASQLAMVVTKPRTACPVAVSVRTGPSPAVRR